jgi:hypothetical protein
MVVEDAVSHERMKALEEIVRAYIRYTTLSLPPSRDAIGTAVFRMWTVWVLLPHLPKKLHIDIRKLYVSLLRR